MNNFKYNIFVIPHDMPQRDSIKNWLLEECTSQWFEVISNSNTLIRFYSPAKFESPMGVSYPSSNQKSSYVVVIGIEDDEEAARFKLIYQDQE